MARAARLPYWPKLMHSCYAEQKLCLRIILDPVKMLKPLWLKYARIWCRACTRIGFTFFLGRLVRRDSLLGLRIGFAFLRYAESEKRMLLTEIIPVERLTVIIKIIHFLMRLRPKQSTEMPKQLIEICKLINLLIKQSTLHLFHRYSQVPRKLSVNT